MHKHTHFSKQVSEVSEEPFGKPHRAPQASSGQGLGTDFQRKNLSIGAAWSHPRADRQEAWWGHAELLATA